MSFPIDYYLFPDIVRQIIKYSNPSTSRNFIETCKHMCQYKKMIIGEYVYYLPSPNSKLSFYDEIKHVRFGHSRIKSCYLENLPKNLESLEMIAEWGKCYGTNKCLVHTFPKEIGYLPDNLRSINIINDDFNCSLDTLPNEIEYVYITSFSFDKSIDMLPNSIRILMMQSKLFAQKINKWPENLEELYIFLPSFEHKIHNLPPNLKLLVIFVSHSHLSLDQLQLPNKLQFLKICSVDMIQRNFQLPNSLEYYSENGFIVINKTNRIKIPASMNKYVSIVEI